MKYTRIIVVGVICAFVPSCGLLKSAGQMPGSLMKSLGRTAGMNVNNEQPTKSELEIQEEEENTLY